MASLTILETHYDLSPTNPQAMSTEFVITCTDKAAYYGINDTGTNPPHAFLIRTAADIVVKNASGTTLTKDVDYFCIQTKRDAAYSKDYSMAIFSQIQFKAVGTYRVTYHLCVGTYVRASFFNYVLTQIKTIIAETIPGLVLRLNGHDTTLASHGTRLDQDESTLSDHTSRLDQDESVIAYHTDVLEDHETRITAAEGDIDTLQSGLASEINTRATADSTLQLNINAEVTARTNADNTLQSNINVETTARTNGDSTNATNLTNHTNATAAHGATSAATAGTLIIRDANKRAQIGDPSDRADISNKGYVDDKCAAISSGSGFVTSASSSSTNGNFTAMSGTTGKVIADSGYSPSSFAAASHDHSSISGSAATAGDADTLDGYHASVAKAANTVVVRNSNGEINNIGGTISTSYLWSTGDVRAATYVCTGCLSTSTKGEPLILYSGDGGTNWQSSALYISNNAGSFEFSDKLHMNGTYIARLDTNGNFSGSAAKLGGYSAANYIRFPAYGAATTTIAINANVFTASVPHWLVVKAASSWMGSLEVIVNGANVAFIGDDINNNTKAQTIILPIPAGALIRINSPATVGNLLNTGSSPYETIISFLMEVTPQ